jgi:hypothetical protein
VYASDGTFLLWSEDRFTGLFGADETGKESNKTESIEMK